MGGEVCYQKGRERGPWFEIQCIQNLIASKEAKGLDATFERKLLKSWSKFPCYEEAREALTALVRNPQRGVLKS